MDNKVLWPGWKENRLIGRGSFGAVYEIQRDIFGEIEKAALKVISIPQSEGDIEAMYDDGYDGESITATFQSHLKSIVAEYSLMRKLSGCINIVNCDDVRYVQHDDGIGWDIFIKMELLTPLTKALSSPISEETTLKLGIDICKALVECKEYGIIHRDIKPQNIFVSPRGDYKLGDFGIAKTVERTMGGTKIGTYKYMAPEVYNNQPYGTAADIYSLGLVLYWALNERRMPFLPLPPIKLTSSMEETSRHRRFSGETLPPPAYGSQELKKIVLKACAYNPKDRYSSAQEMLEALEACAAEYDPDKTVGTSYTHVKILAEQERIRKEKEEQERIRKEKEEQERIRKEKEEQERIRREKEEQERIRREKEKQELLRKAQEEQDRIQKELLESLHRRREQEAQAKLREEQAEQERIRREKEEQERIRREKEEQERIRRDQEARANLRKELEEKERLRKEQKEQRRREKKSKAPLVITCSVIALAAAAAFIFSSNGTDISGWQTMPSGQLSYYDSGKALTGLYEIDGSIYYFHQDGAMATGWATVGNSTCYFQKDGTMYTGWLEDSGNTYLLNSDGILQTGWQTIDNNRYYFNETGVMQTGWQTIDNTRRYFDQYGVLQVGWHTIGGQTYYFTKDGMQVTGLQVIDSTRYFFDENGVLHTGWLYLEGNTYYCSVSENGSFATGKWNIDGENYYFNDEGIMATGSVELAQGDLYFFDEEGRFLYRDVVDSNVSLSYGDRVSFSNAGGGEAWTYCKEVSKTLENVSSFKIEVVLTDLTYGNGEGQWQVRIRDGEGNWKRAGYFKVKDGVGTFEKEYDKPISFSAFACTYYENTQWSGSAQQNLLSISYQTEDFGPVVRSE